MCEHLGAVGRFASLVLSSLLGILTALKYICVALTLAFINGPRSNINKPIQRAYIGSYMTVTTFAQPATVYEIVVVKICVTLTLTLRMDHDQM